MNDAERTPQVHAGQEIDVISLDFGSYGALTVVAMGANDGHGVMHARS
jgi:hypothetical protein